MRRREFTGRAGALSLSVSLGNPVSGLPAVPESYDKQFPGMIAAAGRHNVSRGRMIADFKRMADAVRRWFLPEERQIGALV